MVALSREAGAPWVLGGAAWTDGFVACLLALSTVSLSSMKAIPTPMAKIMDAKR
jgi:hypothetical protein